MRSKIALTIAATLVISGTLNAKECDIAGTWKHAEKAAWLNINTLDHKITVERHEVAPQAEGLTVIQKLYPSGDKKGHWSGEMYHAEKQAYVPITISDKGCKTLIVSDNGVEILRLLKE